jgi:hypothetical protein
MASRAPVAQLDRASAFEAAGRGFNSLRAHHFFAHRLSAIGSRPRQPALQPPVDPHPSESGPVWVSRVSPAGLSLAGFLDGRPMRTLRPPGVVVLHAALLLGIGMPAYAQHPLYAGGTVGCMTLPQAATEQQLGGTRWWGSVVFGVQATPRLGREFESTFGGEFLAQEYTYKPTPLLTAVARDSPPIPVDLLRASGAGRQVCQAPTDRHQSTRTPICPFRVPANSEARKVR